MSALKGWEFTGDPLQFRTPYHTAQTSVSLYRESIKNYFKIILYRM